ncbi:hypothetical protein BDR07DRAFT_1490285 [Suillus spraguei]|nr:hypothetical protein BDR07DRAFT_1490285 [Suillus spraguei]
MLAENRVLTVSVTFPATTASQSIAFSLEKSEALHTLIGQERIEKEENIGKAADRIEEAADALYSSIETYQKVLQTLTPSLDTTQEKINSLAKQMTMTTTDWTQHPTQPLYSAIVVAHLPPSADKAVGRAAIQARQIILDPTPGNTLFPPGSSSKLKEALAKARDNTTPPSTIRAVSTLHNGSIIVKLETESLAHWLSSPAGKHVLKAI